MQLSARSGGSGMRAFLVRLPSGARYWTVLDEDLAVVAVADSFLRQGGVGPGGAGAATEGDAGFVAFFPPGGSPAGPGGAGGGRAPRACLMRAAAPRPRG